MQGYIGVTDYGWYRELYSAETPHEEVNFWQPSGNRLLRKLAPGSPFFFKLKKEHGDAIAGFGIYVRSMPLPIREAWGFFGRSNGVGSMWELLERANHYRRRHSGTDATVSSPIGCRLIVGPIFFPPDMWVSAPRDWSSNTVQGATRSLDDHEYNRVWRECLERAELLQVGGQTRLELEDQLRMVREGRTGKAQLVTPRLGQGTFRASVLDAYGRACAVTTEHSLPVLEAAHIRPWAEDGPHTERNGLLLRADIHRLFDTGYVTVTETGHFEVSRRLREDFDNGKVYYNHHGHRIQLPSDPSRQPDPALLRWHNENRFISA